MLKLCEKIKKALGDSGDRCRSDVTHTQNGSLDTIGECVYLI
jgi:hypothetical protein